MWTREHIDKRFAISDNKIFISLAKVRENVDGYNNGESQRIPHLAEQWMECSHQDAVVLLKLVVCLFWNSTTLLCKVWKKKQYSMLQICQYVNMQICKGAYLVTWCDHILLPVFLRNVKNEVLVIKSIIITKNHHLHHQQIIININNKKTSSSLSPNLSQVPLLRRSSTEPENISKRFLSFTEAHSTRYHLREEVLEQGQGQRWRSYRWNL